MARVLSIQSHVVSGYVGNKSATFPLQLLGIDVDAINSVQFSNHTGYGTVKGTKLTDKDLSDLIDGLIANDLADYTHVLTGYVGSAPFLRTVAQVVKRLKERNPALCYVCDPVMGDNGKLYVSEELIEVYRSDILPLADILTPNQFELSLLLEQPIDTQSDVWRCFDQAFSTYSMKHLVLTSFVTDASDVIEILGRTRTASDPTPHSYRLSVTKLDFYFTGTGDLFAALLLAWSWRMPGDGLGAARNAVCSLQAVCQNTFEYCKTRPDVPKSRELRLIQSKAAIEDPPEAGVLECVEVDLAA
eukprot:m.231352 g.231352  ORF g.231352 m.231352 type:complete len:302 (-) comp15218_c0_seq6:2479-3384(-)